jgi:GTP pyrophosphokinase
LLTQLSKCCRPAPPDAISGFVTRGKGVSIHRDDCRTFLPLLAKHGERVIEVRWGMQKPGQNLLYPVEVSIEATDRQGLLRDISEVFAKEKMNVVGVQTQSVKGTAWMTFTVEVGDAVKPREGVRLGVRVWVAELDGVEPGAGVWVGVSVMVGVGVGVWLGVAVPV